MIRPSDREYIPLYSYRVYILASLISSTMKGGERLKDVKKEEMKMEK
jgi:hypothetical protein